MKKGILIVSFGTTYPGTRKKNIAAITKEVRALYPDALVVEAVSSTIVREAMRRREEIGAYSPDEGLARLKEQGATHVAVLPTHIIDGIENNRMKQMVAEHLQDFEQIEVASPLLAAQQDYVDVAKALWEALKDEVGDAPLILMGHGTEHEADESYGKMERVLREYAKHPVYIATVEGSVTIGGVIARMREEIREKSRVVVTPFMLVAGDHANNDMAGEEDSFASRLREEGYQPECILRGLGEYPAIREIYNSHLREAAGKLYGDQSSQGKKGVLYGIGVGPGKPEMMTIKAQRVMEACDVIVLPAVSPAECYAYRIAEQVCPNIKEKALLCMPFPMIRDEQKLALAHDRIYGAIADYLRQGQQVGLLTIGDPGVYSTYMYMHKRALAEGWDARMISGVPSFCAVAARLGISLGEKTDEIHIIPAAYEIADTLSYKGTRVYMKSGRKLEELLKALREDPRTADCQVCGVSNCGMEDERVYYGLDELAGASGYLTTVIVKP